MKAFLVSQPHEYGLTEVSTPSVHHDQVLVRVAACGICGSDLDILEGSRPSEVTAYPVILGHEFSGEVVEVGAAVKETRVGDRVAIDTVVGCGTCHHCRMGWTCHCLNGFHQLGCTEPGGMAEYVAVPERSVYKVPQGMDLTVAGLTEPASCAAHGVSKAEIKPGDSVVVVGAGPMGSLALQFARLSSPRHLILVEIDDYKLRLGKKLGATHAVDPRTVGVTEAVMEITEGRGADAIIECTGSQEAIQKTFGYIGTKSRIVVIGVPPQRKVEIDFVKLLLRDSVFRASNGYTPTIWLWALQLLSRGVIETDTVISHCLPLIEVDRAFTILGERQEGAIKVMISPNSSISRSYRRESRSGAGGVETV